MNDERPTDDREALLAEADRWPSGIPGDPTPAASPHNLIARLAAALRRSEAPGPSDERFRGIVGEVVSEAERSIAKHGEQRHLPMGTGADTRPLSARDVERGSMHAPGMWPGMTARHVARIATLDTKSHSANEGGDDTCTWWHILREEVFEAAAESDPDALRAELVQVAAVAVKMIDALNAAGSVIRCEYCGDALPRVKNRADISTTPDLQRMGFAADKVVCPVCVDRARAVGGVR